MIHSFFGHVFVQQTAGVYGWSSAQPEHFQSLLPSSWHGGHCEGLALAPDASTVAVSFRRPLGQSSSSIQPAHWLARLEPSCRAEPAGPAAADSVAAAAAASPSTLPAGPSSSHSAAVAVADAVAAGRRQLLSSTLMLLGHSSMQQMTRGCFMPALPDLPSEQLLFASADESSCEPRLWACSSGARLVQAQPWCPMRSPVLQLSGGAAPGFNTILLGALSERQLNIYSYTAGNGHY